MAESGLSGIIQTPGLDFSPIQNFGQQLIQARERQRAADESAMQSAMQVAQYDPELAESIGGKSMARLYKDKGAGKSSDFFKAIHSQSETERSRQSQLFQQQLAESKAKIGLSEAQAGEAGALTQKTKAETAGMVQDQELKKDLDAAQIRYTTNKYAPGEAGANQKQMDYTRLALAYGADKVDVSTMSEADRKAAAKTTQDIQRLNLAQANLNLLNAKGNILVNGKPITDEQLQNYQETGIPPKGMKTHEQQQLDIEMKKADAQAKTASASMVTALAAQKTAEGRSLELAERAQLMQLQYDIATGKLPGGKDLTKLKNLISMAHESKIANLPKETQEQIKNEINLALGGRPETVEHLFGLIKSNNWVFPTPAELAASYGMELPQAPKPDAQAPSVGPTGTLLGNVARGVMRTPSAVGEYAGSQMATGSENVLDLQQALRGKTLTDEQKQNIESAVQKYIQNYIHQLGGLRPTP